MAVITDPPAEPSLAESETSFGEKVIPFDSSVYPFGSPTEKYKFIEFAVSPLVRESTCTTTSVEDALRTV
jgi:hypothetical protein